MPFITKEKTTGLMPHNAYIPQKTQPATKCQKYRAKADDPNEFSDNPKYIFNLLLSIINVSMQTMDLVDSLPPLEIID